MMIEHQQAHCSTAQGSWRKNVVYLMGVLVKSENQHIDYALGRLTKALQNFGSVSRLSRDGVLKGHMLVSKQNETSEFRSRSTFLNINHLTNCAIIIIPP